MAEYVLGSTRIDSIEPRGIVAGQVVPEQHPDPGGDMHAIRPGTTSSLCGQVDDLYVWPESKFPPPPGLDGSVSICAECSALTTS